MALTKAVSSAISGVVADLERLRSELEFPVAAHLPPSAAVLSRLDEACSALKQAMGEDVDDDATEAGTTANLGTQVETVPPGSAGGAAADPMTGATTNVPFSQPVASGDTSSVPGAPDYDPAAQSEVERDAARRQHAAERGESTPPPDPLDDAGAPELDVDGVSDKQRTALATAGYHTAADIRAASDEDLLAIDGIGETTLSRLREATKA